MKKLVFFRIAWMSDYRGASRDDVPRGAGSHVEMTHDGGEVYNFLSQSGKYYGYVRVGGGGRININRLGASTRDQKIENVTVIYFSKNPITGGQYIVGWHKSSLIYRELQNRTRAAKFRHYGYHTVCGKSEGYLLKEDDRFFEIPEDGPGQSNIWYAGEYKRNNFHKTLKEYIADPVNWMYSRPRKSPLSAYQRSAELRKKVEVAAMEASRIYFEKRNYSISSAQIKKSYTFLDKFN
jgi:hypothetical protein